MTLRAFAKAVCVVMVLGALACAAECPLCLRQIPEGVKYCERCKTMMLANEANAADEKKHVDTLIEARADYLARLEEMVRFYEERGDAEGLRRSQAELTDLRTARKLVHQNWEESLPELSAAKPTPEADKLLEEGDASRKKFNPFKRGANLRAAAEKYQEILQMYPNSTAVDSAAFGLGEIYSSGSVGEYRRAVVFYELAYLSNKDIKHEALYHAARVCDGDLAAYEDAARYYWLASHKGISAITRQKAAMRLKQLQKKGYGLAYAEKEKPEPEEKPGGHKEGAEEKPNQDK